MSRKTINLTFEFYEYITLWYRYMRFVCSIKRISMLEATEEYGYRFKKLYSKKYRD